MKKTKKERTMAQLIADYAKTKPRNAVEERAKKAFFSPYCHGFKKPYQFGR